MLPPVGWADVATKSDLQALRLGLRAEMHQSIRNQTWALVTFVGALNAVLMAVCTVVVAALG